MRTVRSVRSLDVEGLHIHIHYESFSRMRRVRSVSHLYVEVSQKISNYQVIGFSRVRSV